MKKSNSTTNMDQNKNNLRPTPFAQTYFHGTKADLKVGDLIEVGFNANFGQRKNAYSNKIVSLEITI